MGHAAVVKELLESSADTDAAREVSSSSKNVEWFYDQVLEWVMAFMILARSHSMPDVVDLFPCQGKSTRSGPYNLMNQLWRSYY